MKFETLLFTDVIVLSELFIGISIIYLVLHCTFVSIQQKYPLIQSSVLYLCVLVLFFSVYLVYNESLYILEFSSFNHTFITDYASFFAKLVIGSLSLFCLLMIHPYLLNQKINNFEYLLLILFSVFGLFLLCSSNDFLTAYLAIEIQSLSFYVLAAFNKKSTFSVDAGIKYFILGSFASSLFLFGVSLIYGISGSICFDEFNILFTSSQCFFDVTDYWFNSYDSLMKKCVENTAFISKAYGETSSPIIFYLIYVEVPVITFIEFLNFYSGSLENSQLQEISGLNIELLKFALVFILIALLFKLTVAPFHLWAPDVYEGSPTSSTFFFSVVPKLSIFVLLLRIFYHSFFSFVESWRYFIVLIVIFSIMVGSFGGINQKKLKSLLVYSTISHMGYSLIAFSAATFESLQMLISYLIVYSFSGLCVWSIFITTRLKNNYFQKQNKDLTDLVLLGKSNYMLAIFFTTVLFSVAGFPPMIGFLVKMGVFLTAMESSLYFIALVSILCSVVGTFYYIRLIKVIYFEKVLVGKLYYPINSQTAMLITILFFLLIFLFVNPTLLFLISQKISLLLLL